MAKQTFFVTGTDTEVGKTYATVAMLRAAADAGLTTLALKPVSAGAEDTADGLRNDDALALADAMTLSLPYEQVNPAVFKTPASPHIAAALDKKSVSVSRLAGFCRGAMTQSYDLGFVEGAGGWRVPVNERENLSQLVRELQLPVILVVGMRLGCLNHAMLTAEAIRNDGLTLAGWIANRIDPDMGFPEENINTLKAALPAPCLGVIPHLTGNQSAAAAANIKIDLLLNQA